MQRILAIALAVVALLAVPVQAVSQTINQTSEGIVAVFYESAVKVKVEVSKDGTSYYYDLRGSDKFPLQMGNGTYRVSVLEHIADNRYKVVHRESLAVELSSEYTPYLASVQNINWSPEDKAIAKAAELAEGMAGEALVKAIYEHVVTSINYDYAKIETLAPGYLPDTEETFMTGQGICYDYAALLAAMLRSQGVPAKLVMGYTPNAVGYHAWNEVLLEGNWVVVDATYDSQMRALGRTYSMMKPVSLYQASKVF